MKRFLIIHYGEIGLKKGNADYFISKLRKQIKTRLEQRFKRVFVVQLTLGRLFIALPDNFSLKDEIEYSEIIGKIFGIKNFKFVYGGSMIIERLGQQILDNFPELSECGTFRVRVKRSMEMDVKSNVAERELGAILLKNGIDMKVKLKGADLVVDVEFFNGKGFFSFKKYQGAGGLTSNSGGKLISLLSAGIDSPVASYMMMKRGARVIFVHFHGYPYTDKNEMEQAKEIVEILSQYQFDTKLYLVPFGFIQKEIAINLDIPGKIRTVLYRRMMLRIAEKISKKEQAKGIISGDNFGQVASQTPENMYTIHDVSTIPLFQPLIGFDKEDIIQVAERIGTFEISKLPCKDSCSMFMPKHPELKANPYDTLDFEKDLPIDRWISKSLEDSEVLFFD